jgi:hypothetical protein
MFSEPLRVEQSDEQIDDHCGGDHHEYDVDGSVERHFAFAFVVAVVANARRISAHTPNPAAVTRR